MKEEREKRLTELERKLLEIAKKKSYLSINDGLRICSDIVLLRKSVYKLCEQGYLGFTPLQNNFDYTGKKEDEEYIFRH